MEVKLQPFQDEFLFSTKKFPCLCAGVGTGKTFMLLLKAWNHAQEYPGSVGLIVRKEYTDLHDSTIKDFRRYFNVNIDSNKEYKFANGSSLMFRHGAELDVLKNMSLSFVGIEQAEELEDETQFIFLRDRLRHPIGLRQLSVICNAKGHNYVWKMWKNNPLSEEYHLVLANSFDNAVNLPDDFVADLKAMEKEAPNHYQQYVMNSFEIMEEDDYVFNFKELMDAKARRFAPRDNYGYRIFGFDIARYGNDKSAALGLQQMGALLWRVCHAEQWEHKDLDYTTGRILYITNENRADESVVDEEGLGAGPLDFIQKGRSREDFKGFRNVAYSTDRNKNYANARTEAAFTVKELVNKGWLAIEDEDTIQELMTLRYKYTNDGRKILVSKEEMRKKGVKSPNLADALLMAASRISSVKTEQDSQYAPRATGYTKDANLFEIAGVR